MTININPPLPATQIYPWMVVQEFYKNILEAKSISQEAVDPNLAFLVVKNRYQDFIDPAIDKVVNILISNIEDSQQSQHGKEKIVTFAFQFFASAESSLNVSADEMVIEKAMYLSAVVEETITALYNYRDPSLPIGSMTRGGMQHSFSVPTDINTSDKLYFGGDMQLYVKFYYKFLDESYQDLLNVNVKLFNFDHDFTINRS